MKKFGIVKMLTIAALSTVTLVASIAMAQSVKTGRANGDRHQWDAAGMRHGFYRGGFLFNRLNLTDDQKTKLKQFRQSFLDTNKPVLEQLRAKRQELRQASEGGTFNEALATQKLTEMASLQAKLMGERFKLRQEMQSVLTAEQKAQLDQLKTQFKSHRGQKRGAGEQRNDW